ncbi:MAG: arginine--tRNA ligase, partial [Gammaproteobacteria bacterium]
MQERLHNPLVNHLAQRIATGLQAMACSELSVEQIAALLSPAPQLNMGHYAFPCFSLAKALRQAPPAIALKLVDHLETDDVIAQVRAAGPYVNVVFQLSAYGQLLIEPICAGHFFQQTLTKTPTRVMIEYSQPNTHKELHVGHMRNLCLGNALVEINRYVGNTVLAVTYPGDVGTHVAKCLWYIAYQHRGPLPTENRGEWLARMYVAGTAQLDAEKGTEKEAQNREQLTEILQQIHAGKGEFFTLWRETRQWSLDLMREVYAWADVTFDRWFFESEMDAPSVAYMHELHAAGKLVMDQGAIGMNLEADKLGFCLLVKSDGTGLYATKDVTLARQKFEEYGVERSIYVVDNRQTFHFQQVFKVLEKLGFERATACYHLPYEMVELPNGAMSSRRGNVVPLLTLIHNMEAAVVCDYLEKYRGDWSDEEIAVTARQIANSAIKYGMIRFDNNRKIVFDMSEWLCLDGETGPNLQYAVARINALLKKIKTDAEELAKKIGDLTLERKTKAGESGRIFGAVTPLQVADSLKEKGFEVT